MDLIFDFRSSGLKSMTRTISATEDKVAISKILRSLLNHSNEKSRFFKMFINDHFILLRRLGRLQFGDGALRIIKNVIINNF